MVARFSSTKSANFPCSPQVKFLRILQDGKVLAVGSRSHRDVDVRIIAATNRSLAGEVAEGRFREDLFYRLAVADLKLPALREREGDLGLLVDRLLEQVNEEHAGSAGLRDTRKFLQAQEIFSSRIRGPVTSANC